MPGAQHELKKHYMAGENHHISLGYCTKRTLRKNGDNVLLTARGFSFLSVPTASGGPSCTHKTTAGAGDEREHESGTGTGLTYFQQSWEVGIFILILKILHRLVKSSNLSKSRT